LSSEVAAKSRTRFNMARDTVSMTRVAQPRLVDLTIQGAINDSLTPKPGLIHYCPFYSKTPVSCHNPSSNNMHVRRNSLTRKPLHNHLERSCPKHDTDSSPATTRGGRVLFDSVPFQSPPQRGEGFHHLFRQPTLSTLKAFYIIRKRCHNTWYFVPFLNYQASGCLFPSL
jgi:hypothetical protein